MSIMVANRPLASPVHGTIRVGCRYTDQKWGENHSKMEGRSISSLESGR